MTNRIALLVISIISCIFMESSLKAAAIPEPTLQASSELTEKQIEGAKQIAYAILDNDSRRVRILFSDNFEQNVLMYRDPKTALRLVRNLNKALQTMIKKFGDKSLNSLNNEAGKFFTYIINVNESLLMAQAQAGVSPELINYWTTGAITWRPLRRHAQIIYSLAFSPDGYLLASGSASTGIFRAESDDSTIALWNVEGAKRIPISNREREDINSVAFSPNNKMLAYAVENTIKLYDLYGQGEIHVLTGHTRPIRSLAFSPNCKFLVSAAEDNTVRVWDVSKRKVILKQKEISPWGTAFSPDGTILAYFYGVDAKFSARLVNIATGKKVKEIRLGGARIRAPQFAPNLKLLAFGLEDGIINVWNIDENRRIAQLAAPAGSDTYCLSFSPDSKLVAAGYRQDKIEASTIRLWNIGTVSEARLIYQDNKDIVRELAFTPDGKTIAAGYNHGMIKLIWTAEEQEYEPAEVDPKYKGVARASK